MEKKKAKRDRGIKYFPAEFHHTTYTGISAENDGVYAPNISITSQFV
jgi:hypothetical protein